MRLHRTIWASAVISFICTAALAQEPLTGTVKKVDQQKGTITIQQTQSGRRGATAEYKVKDPLTFNELKPGDKVAFSYFKGDTSKTIERLSKDRTMAYGRQSGRFAD